MQPVFEIIVISTSALSLVFAQTFIFIFVGAALCSNLLREGSKPLNLYFKSGVFFFIGLATSLAYFRFCDLMLGDARASACITITTSILLAIFRHRELRVVVSEVGRQLRFLPIFWISVIFSCVGIFTLLVGATSGGREHYGSGHVGQYSKIAIFIADANYIPTLGRHYGQSILASTGLMLGLEKGPLLLYLWLVVSKVMLMLLTFGFFRTFLSPFNKQVLATLLIFLGQTSLSLIWVHNIDSITPFVGSEYSDSMTGIGSIFAFIFILFRTLRQKLNSIANFALFFILCLFWAISMPMNLIFAPIVFLIWLFGPRKTHQMRTRLPLGVATIFIAIGVAIFQGGPLSPEKIRTDDPFFSTMISATGSVEYFPRLPYFYFSGKMFGTGSWHQFHSDDITKEKTFHNPAAHDRHLSAQDWWTLESNLWTATRVHFFALFGLMMFLFRWFRAVPHPERLAAIIDLSPFLIAVTVVTICGFVTSFLFSLGDLKWPMSRFNLFAGFFGLLITAIWIFDERESKRSLDRVLSRTLRILVLIFMLFGPTTNFTLRVFNVSLVSSPSDLVHELILETSGAE